MTAVTITAATANCVRPNNCSSPCRLSIGRQNALAAVPLGREKLQPKEFQQNIRPCLQSCLGGPAPIGQLAGLLHPTGGLSFVELVGFPLAEGALEFDREQGHGTGAREAPSKKTSLKWALRGDREEPA